MNQEDTTQRFHSANPHALNAILAASETQAIIACRDIFDMNGIKLWARDQPVSRDLQLKLMDRILKQPLEACLIAEDGVSIRTLTQALNDLLARDGSLSTLLRPTAHALQISVSAVRLHPVVQLLLTASQSSRPQAFAHAIEAMAMCGAMVKHSGGNDRQVSQAMTAGLLHDIGEMYMAPEYGEADVGETLDVECFRQLVVHPHVGRLLIGQLTDYPKDIVRAVGEHHERLDGSGYPYRLQGDQISPLGRLMAAAEAALATLRLPGATLRHASVALRVIPGEFDDRLAGPLSEAARREAPLSAKHSLDELQADLARMNVGLQTSLNRLEAATPPMPSVGLQRAADLSRHLLMRLRSGWNESGLWSPEAIGQDQIAEVEAIQETLRQRMRTIERAARLSAGDLSDDDAEHLDHMCACLTDDLKA